MKVCVTGRTSRTQAPFFVVEESEYEAIRKLIKLFLRNYLFDIVLFKVASYPGSSLAKKKIIILQGRSLGMMLRSKINESHFFGGSNGWVFWHAIRTTLPQ